jgi:hypothetical protein
MTFAPSASNVWTVASPMLPAPPVTMQVFPSTNPKTSSPFCVGSCECRVFVRYCFTSALSDDLRAPLQLNRERIRAWVFPEVDAALTFTTHG